MNNVNFVIGYVNIQAGIDDNNWLCHNTAETMDEARRIAQSKAQRGALVVGVFPIHHWNLGCVSCKPRYMIDNRDYTNAPIRNAESIINSASSTVL